MSNEWFYRLDQETIGPLAATDLAAMAADRRLLPGDHVRRGTSGEWVAAARLKGLAFGPTEPPPLPTSTSLPRSVDRNETSIGKSGDDAIVPTFGDGLAMLRRLPTYAWLFLPRVTRGDFGRDRATEEERRDLKSASEPVTAPLSQDYAAWRRAFLASAALAMGTHVLLSLWNFELPAADAGHYNQVVVAIYLISLIVAEAIGTWFVARAALEWAGVRRSQRLARLAWLATFLVPAVIFAVPIVQLMDLDTAGKTVMGPIMALGVFLTFLPKVLGIFPGVIRACLSLKSLLPEAAAPSWGTVLVAPIAALFFLLAFFVGVHAQAGLPLALALALWTAAPLVFVRGAEPLTQALPEIEGRALVGALRNRSKLFVVAGGVSCIWQFFRWFDPGDITMSDALGVVTGTVGSMLLLTVVAADFFLPLLHQALLSQQENQGTALESELAGKLRSLTNAGVADNGSR